MPDERPFWCTTCTVTQVSAGIPRGWFLLGRSRGIPNPLARLGMYCSLECLVEQLPRLRLKTSIHDLNVERATA